jgi:hypothetical protein
MTVIKAFEGGKTTGELNEEIAGRIQDVIDEYAGRTTLPAILGILELIKFDLIDSALTEE